jgi:Flp pilus assembly protein TadG
MRSLRRHMIYPRQRQRGAVAIIVGLSIVVLVGMIGLVVDLGHLFVFKTELQNAADSCAMAAAKELDGTTDALVRAESAGITVGQKNKADLQATAVSIQPSDVKFSAVLSPNSTYLSRADSADPATSKYAMCTLNRSGIAMWFMQVLGFGNQAVAAEAVATLAPSQTTCAIPLGMCKPATPPVSCSGGGVPDSQGMCVGDWVSGRFDSGGGLTGNFNWIDFTPPSGGASELTALLTGAGQCNLNVSTQVGQTGGLGNAAEKAWNSRFGLYQPGAGNPQPATAQPDFTGFSYTTTPQGITAWPTQRDALSNFLSKEALPLPSPYQGNAQTGLSVNIPPYQSQSSTQLAAVGAKRRLATAPLVNCSAWASSTTVPIVAWACILMLHPIGSPSDTVTMEYRGLSNNPSSPCASFGIPGGTAGPLVPVLVQ